MSKMQDIRTTTHRSARKNARKIDANTWARHQPEIETLFVKEKKPLKSVDGQDGVIEIMRKRHEFVAT